MDKLRFGILSTGNIARQFAQGVIGGAQRSSITAVASRSAHSAEAFTLTHAIGKHYAGYDALLEDPDVDAIYNALPNSLHAQWTRKALDAGKHVLCEKPLAMDTRQAVEMFDHAKRAGRLLVEAFMYRCHPQTRAALQAIRSGDIGEVRLIRTTFCYRTKKIDGNVRFDKVAGRRARSSTSAATASTSRPADHSAVRPITRSRRPAGCMARLPAGGVDIAASGSARVCRAVCPDDVYLRAWTRRASNLAQVCGTEGYIEVPVPWKPPAEQRELVRCAPDDPAQAGRRRGHGGRNKARRHETRSRIPP